MIIKKEDKKLHGSICLPASKSISNRLLMIRVLSGRNFNIFNLSDADDSRLLSEHLAEIEVHSKNQSEEICELDCDNAGTVMRFLTAYLSTINGEWVLSGSEQMKKRPIAILVNALRNLGASIDYLNENGFPPVLIHGGQIHGGCIEMDAGISSQFISALLMIAPVLLGGLTIKLSGNIISKPYIDLTVSLLKYFGVQTEIQNNVISIEEQDYNANDFTVEADWSAASYWYQMAVLADDVDLTLIGLMENGLQGDAIVSEVFEHFGIKTEFLPGSVRITKKGKINRRLTFDFSDFPDIAPTLIVTCAGIGTDGDFSGLQSLRIKETDRLEALKTELAKTGFQFGKYPDSETWHLIKEQNWKMQEISINTYNDHRMAMAFAPLALKFGQISIENPEVVSKSYPQFWNDIQSVGFQVIK